MFTTALYAHLKYMLVFNLMGLYGSFSCTFMHSLHPKKKIVEVKKNPFIE